MGHDGYDRQLPIKLLSQLPLLGGYLYDVESRLEGQGELALLCPISFSRAGVFPYQLPR